MRREGEGAPAPDQTVRYTVEFFKLLADETRLRIVRVLQEREELNVQTLCRILDLTQPAVSHHLALLRVAGMIELRRQGKHNYYRLLPARLVELSTLITTLIPGESRASPEH